MAVPVVWRTSTVQEVLPETPRARTLVLSVPGWPGHRAGQHVDLRLTAEDGYQAQRSYSIASAPETPGVQLTVERLEDGEVSPYLVDVVRPGDELELRGPVGGHFSWSVEDGGPVLLVAGGSGLVPLMAMLRHRAARGSSVEVMLLLSARGLEDLLYAGELDRLGEDPALRIVRTLTRTAPPGWTGRRGRIDAAMLAEVGADTTAACFVCGPTPFVETATGLLVDAGHDPRRIHAERFGATGGG